MSSRKIKKIDLDSLNNGIPAVSEGKAKMLKETCIWCLNSCKHQNGVALTAQNNKNTEILPICWNEKSIDRDAIDRAYNKEDAIEFGAEALSFILVRECTKYTAIRRSATGTGIDYWLGKKRRAGNKIFSSADARLEISGILKQTTSNSVKRRVKEKLEQTTPTDKSFPVFISIIEFGQPQAEMVLKNVQS